MGRQGFLLWSRHRRPPRPSPGPKALGQTQLARAHCAASLPFLKPSSSPFHPPRPPQKHLAIHARPETPCVLCAVSPRVPAAAVLGIGLFVALFLFPFFVCFPAPPFLLARLVPCLPAGRSAQREARISLDSSLCPRPSRKRLSIAQQPSRRRFRQGLQLALTRSAPGTLFLPFLPPAFSASRASSVNQELP